MKIRGNIEAEEKKRMELGRGMRVPTSSPSIYIISIHQPLPRSSTAAGSLAASDKFLRHNPFPVRRLLLGHAPPLCHRIIDPKLITVPILSSHGRVTPGCVSHSPFTLANFSFVNLVFIFRCSSSTTNPVCERRVNLLACSLPLHQH
jgi:hypothetical protein